MLRALLVALCCSVASTLAAQDTNAIQNWITQLNSPDSTTRFNACFSFPDRQSGPKDLELLYDNLKTGNNYLKINIINAIGRNRLAPRTSIPRLIRLLSDTTEEVAEQAAFCLSIFGPQAAPSLAAVMNRRRNYRNPTDGDNEYSPGAYAEAALRLIGKDALPAIDKRKKDRFKSLSAHIDASLPEEERAARQHVSAEYRKLIHLFLDADSTTIPYLDSIPWEQNGLLRRIFLNNLRDISNRPLTIKIASLLVNRSADPNVRVVLAQLPPDVIADPRVFPGYLRCLNAYHNTDMVTAFSRASYDTVQADSADIATLFELIDHYGNSEVTDDLLYGLSDLTPPAAIYTSPAYHQLLAFLHHRNPDFRLYAYRTVLAWHTPDLLSVAHAGLSDPSDPVRSACLNYFFTEQPDDTIYSTYVIGSLRNGVGKNGYLSVEDNELLKMAAHLNSSYKDTLLQVIGRQIADTSAIGKLPGYSKISLLETLFKLELRLTPENINRIRAYVDSPFYREAAVEVICAKDSLQPSDVPLILDLLSRKDSLLHALVLAQLGFARKLNANEPIVAALLNEYDTCPASPRRETIARLVIGNDTVLPIVFDHLAGTSHPDELATSLVGRGASRYPQTDSLAYLFLTGSNRAKKRGAITYFSARPYALPQVVPLLRNILVDTLEDLSVQDEILTNMNSIGDSSFIPVLVKFIRHAHSHYRQGRAFDHLIKLVRGDNPVIRASADTSVVDLLEELLVSSNTDLQLSAIHALGLLDSLDEPAEDKLFSLLHSTNPAIAQAATASLLVHDRSATRAGRYLYYAMNLQYVDNLMITDGKLSTRNPFRVARRRRYKSGRQRYAQMQTAALSEIVVTSAFTSTKQSLTAFTSGALSTEPAEIATLPWPPPPASTKTTIPDNLVRRYTTIGTMYQAIIDALDKCEYEDTKTFLVDSGFAVLTKLERIADNGAPADHDRWFLGKASPHNFTDYIVDLLWGARGTFRVILFIVKPRDVADTGRPLMTTTSAAAIYKRGSSYLPGGKFREQPMGDRHVHVLIYQFQNKDNGEAKRVLPQDILLGTMQQLRATKFIQYISN